jgi:hypothetical protein
METIGLVAVLIVGLFVVWKLGLFSPVIQLSDVATRESAAYNREHKLRVAKRYEQLDINVESAEKITQNIALIDAFNFD